MDNKDMKLEQKICGQSKNGEIVCLGIRLEDGIIGDMPIVEKGTNKGKINQKALVGSKVVFYNKNKDKYYNIEVLEYINVKNKDKRFIVKYQDELKKEMSCNSFIKSCQIKNVVNDFQSPNTFKKVDDYYVMTVKTKGTKWEEDFNGEAVEILFDGTEEVVKKIMKSTWCLAKKGKNKDTYYIQTTNYNQVGQNIKLHQVVFNQEVPKGDVINHINRAEGSWKDNRLSNLELASKKENARNKAGAGYTRKNGKNWNYTIAVDGFVICTPTRKTYEEADIDALIVQEHFNYTHRQNEWDKTKDINQEYKDELIQLMEQKLEKVKAKGYKFIKNEFEIIEIDGVEVAKVFDSKGRYCLIDKEDLWISDLGRISQNNEGYWNIRINNKLYRLHRYILGIKETNKYNVIHVDHINQNPSDNRRSNLRITTKDGNLSNKDSKGYRFQDNYNSYLVYYRSLHDILKQHGQISKTTSPSFKTELEAQEEVYKRKYLANYIMPKFKNLDEYLIFEEEYNSNKKDGQTLDDYWIITRFPNINEIEIPKFSEESVDKL